MSLGRALERILSSTSLAAPDLAPSLSFLPVKWYRTTIPISGLLLHPIHDRAYHKSTTDYLPDDFTDALGKTWCHIQELISAQKLISV
jgi:hypothetical protein